MLGGGAAAWLSGMRVSEESVRDSACALLLLVLLQAEGAAVGTAAARRRLLLQQQQARRASSASCLLLGAAAAGAGAEEGAASSRRSGGGAGAAAGAAASSCLTTPHMHACVKPLVGVAGCLCAGRRGPKLRRTAWATKQAAIEPSSLRVLAIASVLASPSRCPAQLLRDAAAPPALPSVRPFRDPSLAPAAAAAQSTRHGPHWAGAGAPQRALCGQRKELCALDKGLAQPRPTGPAMRAERCCG